MRFARILPVLCLLLAPGSAPARDAWGAVLPIVGAAEEVVLLPWGLQLRARLDTGAAFSSVDARSIRVRVVKGQKLARFIVVGDDGSQAALELPLVGYRRIASADGGVRSRPLVEMEACVAGQRVRAEFTLASRAHMDFHLLIGRNILAGRFLVNAVTQYTAPPGCQVSR